MVYYARNFLYSFDISHDLKKKKLRHFNTESFRNSYRTILIYCVQFLNTIN